MKITKKILIVDDDIFFLEALSEALEEVGYKALKAKSWADITEIIALTVPDVILLDLVIPSLDGAKICRILKKNRKTQNVPVLLYSGKKPEELQKIAQEVGIQGVLEKSNDFDQIVINIIRFFKSLNSKEMN